MSPVVGNDFASGVVLRGAYDAILDATAESPVLLKLEPGTYNIGFSTWELTKSHIDLEGSGREISRIVGLQGNADLMRIVVEVRLSRLSVSSEGGTSVMVIGRADIQDARISNSAAPFSVIGIYFWLLSRICG